MIYYIYYSKRYKMPFKTSWISQFILPNVPFPETSLALSLVVIVFSSKPEQVLATCLTAVLLDVDTVQSAK